MKKQRFFKSMTKKLHYFWQDLEDDCRKLAKILKDKKFDCIVGIARGGVIPAVIISHLLNNKKFRILNYSYYEGTVRKKKLISFFGIPKDLKRQNILLVDDVVDSGETMKRAVEDLEKRKNRVISVTLHYKSKLKPKVKPDYFAGDPGTAWVVYPWEN